MARGRKADSEVWDPLYDLPWYINSFVVKQFQRKPQRGEEEGKKGLPKKLP